MIKYFCQILFCKFKQFYSLCWHILVSFSSVEFSDLLAQIPWLICLAYAFMKFQSSFKWYFVYLNLKAFLGKKSINAQRSASYWLCWLFVIYIVQTSFKNKGCCIQTTNQTSKGRFQKLFILLLVEFSMKGGGGVRPIHRR